MLREGRISCCALYLERARDYLRELRVYRPEAEASAAVQELARAIGEQMPVPTIVWSADPLQPPILG